MNRRQFNRLAVLTGLYGCTGPVFSALASSGSEIEIDIPQAVAVGDPFVCRFQGTRPQRIELAWEKKTLSLELRLKDGIYSEMCLLGAGLKLAPGKKKIGLVVDGRKMERSVLVRKKKFAEQWLTVKPGKVSLTQKELDRHYREKALVRAVLDKTSPGRFWSLPLFRPVSGEISSVFGLRRFFNKQPRSPHSGVDFRGKKGTPVRACADGVVALTGNHFFAGNSVYIDHGLGVVSMYFHLSETDVKEGQFVESGQGIGKIGSTGRVTGPHLHFGLSVLGTLVDPMPLFEAADK